MKVPNKAGDITSPVTEANRRLWLLTVAHAVTHMRGAVLPLIYPVLMRTMRFGYIDLGFMLSVTRLIGGLLQGIWGKVSKIVPGNIIIALENWGISIGMGLAGMSVNVGELTGAVAFGQIAASPQHPVASSMLSRWFSTRRGHALGIHFAGGNVGTVLSPIIATFLLLRVGWQDTLYLFMIPGVIVGVLVFFRLPKELAPVKNKKSRERVRFGGDFFQPLKDAKVRRLIITGSITAGGKGLGILNTFVPLLLIRGMHLPIAESGLLFTVFTATSVIGPVLTGRVSDRYNRPRFLSVLLLLSFVSSVATAFLYRQDIWLLIVSLIVMGLVVHSYSPVEQAIMGDLTEKTLPEQAYSLFYGMTFGVSAAWPLLFALVLNRWGFTALFLAISVTYAIGAWVYGTRDWAPPPAETL